VRLFGVSLWALRKDDNQITLFRDAGREKRAAMTKTMNAVNNKFGEYSITFASTISGEEK
jgi:hypothetical protein